MTEMKTQESGPAIRFEALEKLEGQILAMHHAQREDTDFTALLQKHNDLNDALLASLRGDTSGDLSAFLDHITSYDQELNGTYPLLR